MERNLERPGVSHFSRRNENFVLVLRCLVAAARSLCRGPCGWKGQTHGTKKRCRGYPLPRMGGILTLIYR